jgi:hypothetical protein
MRCTVNQSMVSREGAKDAEQAGYELGDLELAPKRSHAAPSAPSLPSDPDHDPLPALATFKPSRPANDFETVFERGAQQTLSDDETGFDTDLSGPSLELDLAAPALTLRAEPAPAERASSPRPSLESARTSQPSLSPRTPSGSPRDPERAAHALAGYGEPPSGFGGAAPYLVRVGLRMFTLLRERRELESVASERADVYERALDALGRALLNDHEVCAHEALREQVALVEAKQRALSEVEAATRDVRAREERAIAALEEARAKLEAELAPYVEAEHKAAREHEKLETELRRTQARVARAEIELRAIGKASLPPPAERVKSIESEREERANELARLTARHAEASTELGRARRELALRRGGLDVLERQHEQRMAQARALHGRFDSDVAAAERTLRAALCGLAEAADALAIPHTAADEIRDVRAAEAQLDEVVERLTRYDRALALYDRDALVRGALVLLLGLLALVLLVRML